MIFFDWENPLIHNTLHDLKFNYTQKNLLKILASKTSFFSDTYINLSGFLPKVNQGFKTLDYVKQR